MNKSNHGVIVVISTINTATNISASSIDGHPRSGILRPLTYFFTWSTYFVAFVKLLPRLLE